VKPCLRGLVRISEPLLRDRPDPVGQISSGEATRTRRGLDKLSVNLPTRPPGTLTPSVAAPQQASRGAGTPLVSCFCAVWHFRWVEAVRGDGLVGVAFAPVAQSESKTTTPTVYVVIHVTLTDSKVVVSPKPRPGARRLGSSCAISARNRSPSTFGKHTPGLGDLFGFRSADQATNAKDSASLPLGSRCHPVLHRGFVC